MRLAPEGKIVAFVKCSTPEINEFTITSTNTDVVPSTEVTYTCEFGYQLPAGDLGTRMCQLGGTWPAPPPACEVTKCSAPGINEFTITSTNTDVVPSTEVTYTCEFGYQLPAGDLGTRVCQLGGTWPAPPPACEVTKCSAPGINEFTITSTNTDVVPSTEVTYTCDFGYQLPAGDLGTRVCQLGGTWPAPPPACEVTKCTAPGINEFTITSTNTDVVPSTEVTYTCEFGYQLPAGDLGTRVCQLGGKWPAPPPACEVTKCTAPGINEFTITSTNTDVVPSTEVTYTCEFGYQLPAGDLGTRICQLGGTWPAPPPACEVTKCTAPGINEFTITSTNTDVVPSTEVTYTCEFGYQLPAGDLGTRICQLGGIWPAPPPACEVTKCSAPGINEFTIASTNTDVVPSTEVTYTCEFGYQLPAGDLGTRICQLGGIWPAPPPACEVTKCSAPGINEFTITSTNTDVVPSTEVTYTCEFGYQLPAGDLGTRICQLGGTWPAPPPACEVIKCTAPGINEFTITSTNTDVVPSTEVTYTCEFGYQLPDGDLGTRICQLGGTWPAPPPSCEVTKCSAPGINEFTITSTNTDVVPSTEVTYTCKFGYQLPAGELGTRICQLGGTWPAPPPACEVTKCTAPGINEFTITSTNTDVVPSTEVTYTCAFGYQLPAGDLGTRICQLGGTWPAPPPACEVIKCAAPGLNEFTITSTNTDVVPSTEVTYTCEFGYQLPAGDLGTRICQLGGTWPAPPPPCEVIKCKAPGINEFTITSTNTDVVPSTEVTYTCEFGYQLPAGDLGTRRCQLGGTWPAPPPACEVVKCTAPEINEFTITSTNTDVVPSAEVTYTCEFGYQLPAGDLGTRICQLGGTWPAPPPACEVMKCTAPGLNEFTITSTNTDVVPSTEVTYTCEFGYQLPAGDLGTRICQLGGTWPAPPPACEVVKCTAPEINEFTITSTNTDVVPSAEVTYTCEFGYQLPAGDLGTRICQLGGTWPAPPPACEVIKCTAPGINQFTITSTNTDVVPSTEVTYTCEFGYQLPAGDLGTRICQLGGTWPALPPACEVMKCTAPGLNEFTITSTNTDVVPSTEVTYTCEFGYQLPAGDLGTRICHLGGTWPAPPPACEVIKCTAPGINQFTITSTNTDVVPSTEVTYTCEFGYQLPAGDLGTRICQLGGTWPALPPACEVMKCTAPGLNEFTITSTNTDVVPSTEVTYTCEFGYQLPAGDLGTRICQLGGTWPAPPPACEVVKCTAPEINEFTITSTNTDVVPSAEVTYTCEFGYQLPAGDLGTRICQLGGTWPAPPPACEVIKCTAPGINQFTITSTNTDVVPSTEVTYTCEFGYQLPAGDLGTRICQLGGTWPALPPACEVMKCTAPGLNEFTITSTNTDVVPSTEVTYTCEFGYQLPAGDLGTRICQLGGTWPAPPPACEVIKCAAPGLNEFTITSTNTDVVPSTEVTYTCKFGYHLPAGDLGTRICQLGGTWPALPPACEVVKCTAPEINEFTITSTNTDVVPSTEVTYTCEFGYQFPTADLGTRVCQLGGTWPTPPPACEVMKCTAPGLNEFTITSTNTDVVPSTEVTYTCEFGYQLPAGDLGTRICQLGGTWPTPPPACEVIKCDISGYNQFTIPSSTDTVVPETEVSYTCLPGYQLPAGDLGTRICQLGGTWPTPPPACEDIDECLTTPCQNGATCHNEVNAYSCTCMPGYEGTDCEINIDECATAVCQNGATCNDLVNGYTCTCATGYTDTHCETEIPCEDPQTITHASATITGLEVGDTVEYECNFGYLLNGNSLLTCVVGPSWDGTLPTCSIIECVKPSAPVHTSTGGSGKLGGFGFNTNTNSVPGQSITYTCNAGYELTGGDLTRNCELGGGWDGQEPVCTEIDECEGIVCENGGTCVDGFLSYSCECIEHFEGTHCETNTDNCVGNDCENGATCVDGLSSYTCNCAEDFEGDFCETRIDDCENNPCLNGATCVDGINSYTCTCPDSHTGEHCEIDIDFCDGVNCLNGGSCQDGLLTFTCNCDQSTAYYGQFCQNLDGAWGEWNDWSPCSATCGDGIETSTRTCTSPPPEGEGSICQGEGAKTQSCNLMDCKWPSNANTEFCTSKAAGSYANPDDCTSYYICRDDFTGALLEYCMEGENWDDTSKQCDSNAPCDSEDVGDADVDGGWSDWSAGPCSESCGTGTKVLTRTCTNPTPQNNGAECVGEGSKTEPCERSLCQAGGCQEVRCESWQYDQENCNVTGMVPDSLIYSMEIIKRLTGAPCVKNETFGYNERKDIWVDSGCQGDFQVCFIREYDDCSPAPCLNGGTCTDGIADYECTCASGFYGDNCEQVRNSCYGVDCNGGTCVVDSQDATQYTCQCADGATGDHCEDMDTGGMQSAASNVQISLFGTFLAVTMAMIWNLI
ncbi:sushi, von Willebrand factor type A, EGF and pentraxin domain-containing protein 1-like [Mytilus galloprovincialis]|uniref:sushi, von Willebrand factor type A, EGF and pentraxin domain-containing protein 1-like n=1 Tax=Mytilus galloprovincialis TaxID=29158 RepID=UPI003F7B4D53